VDPTGLDALVIIGGYQGGNNPFGHASIAITGAGLYSFGTGNRCGDDVSKFLLEQSQVRNQTIFTIKTSPAQDAQMLRYLQQFSNCKDVGKLDNCAARTEGALQSAGFLLLDPTDSFGSVTPFPQSLLQALFVLQGIGQASSVYAPQGTIPSVDVTSFEHQH
jgi:hypothetical protein